MRERIHTVKCNGKELLGKSVTVKGWIRTVRHQKTFSFIELNDGSCLSNLQIIADHGLESLEEIKQHLTTGASIAATGELVKSPGGKQAFELQAKKLELIGACSPEEYPLQKKRHSFEFLRSIAHLRPRTNSLGAVTRVRNTLSFATHQFFQERGFLYLHTPILTGSDCEGAGKMFQVTTLDPARPPRNEEGEVDHSLDFFAKPAYLTVSGQLNGEIYACSHSDVYTFGPTFRAENSHTSRHLAEFWMVEPEIAFADLNDCVDLAEAYLKKIFQAVLDECDEDLQLFDRFIQKGLIDRLKLTAERPFERMTYTEAVDILQKSGKKFEYAVEWGIDLQSEHERYLCEEHCKAPLILTDYPKQIKPFYMRENGDGKTVAALDILLPGIGEIIGGSQREERLEPLERRMEALEMEKQPYWWYLELRKYGSVPHAGFGAGFERIVQYATGMENIRDVIPFPRTPGNVEF